MGAPERRPVAPVTLPCLKPSTAVCSDADSRGKQLKMKSLAVFTIFTKDEFAPSPTGFRSFNLLFHQKSLTYSKLNDL